MGETLALGFFSYLSHITNTDGGLVRCHVSSSHHKSAHPPPRAQTGAFFIFFKDALPVFILNIKLALKNDLMRVQQYNVKQSGGGGGFLNHHNTVVTFAGFGVVW